MNRVTVKKGHTYLHDAHKHVGTDSTGMVELPFLSKLNGRIALGLKKIEGQIALGVKTDSLYLIQKF